MIDFGQFRGVEFSGPSEINDIQKRLFKNHLKYICETSPYYKRTLKGLDLSHIELADISGLPFTDKSAFEQFNKELLAVPMSSISDIVLSSGTTGKPTKIMYTSGDLDRLAYNEKISFESCGITPDDIVLLTCTIDRCFIAGLAYFLGIRATGAAAVRNGLSSVSSHMEIVRRMSPTVIVGVPSFLYKLGQFLQANGLVPEKTAVKKLICIGEPIRDRNIELMKIGRSLEEIWSADVYSTYASSETITTFCECTAKKGGHLHPDLAVVEIVNEAGEPVPHGEAGEVVVTPLAVEGMPLLRFRTGDISFLIDGACDCGRHSLRLGPIIGRKKQMIKFRGTTLYPQSIYTVLDECPEVSDYYIVVTSDHNLSDVLNVHVSFNNSSSSSVQRILCKKIMDRLQARLRVRPEVTISTEEEIKKVILPPTSRKINRFIDRRQN